MAATAATVVVAAIVIESAAVLSTAVAAIVTVVVAAAAVLVHPSWWASSSRPTCPSRSSTARVTVSLPPAEGAAGRAPPAEGAAGRAPPAEGAAGRAPPATGTGWPPARVRVCVPCMCPLMHVDVHGPAVACRIARTARRSTARSHAGIPCRGSGIRAVLAVFRAVLAVLAPNFGANTANTLILCVVLESISCIS